MFRFRMPFAVAAAEGEELLPSWTPLGMEVFEEIASRRRRSPFPRAPLLTHGTIRGDMLRFLGEGPYRAIFDTSERVASTARIMEKVLFPVPVLEGIGRFATLDPYTYRHALCVFALSTLLAEKIGDEEERLRGAEGGPLHDLGKLAVPVQILRKTTPLTRSERDLLNYHTSAGAALLAFYSGETGSAVRMALEHHERVDGSGYLRGIPLASRIVEIVAVCDVYDALVAPRPYRPVAFDNRSAIEEIAAAARAGRFSLDVVRALVAVNRQGKPAPEEVTVSLEVRGAPPPGNLYGVILGEGETGEP